MNPPSYEEFKKWVKKQGIKTGDEFRKFYRTKLPLNYPKDPRAFFTARGTWKGWGNITGKEPYRLQNPPSYEKFKKWVQNREITNKRQLYGRWRTKLPAGYPKDPESFYWDRGTWKGWNDFCGTEPYRLQNAPPYAEYKKWVQKQRIKNLKELRRLDKSKFPPGYSKRPDYYYKKQGTWKGFNDLFGTEQYFMLNAPPYAEYKKWVQKQGIKTQREWRRFDKSKFPPGYPKEPSKFYKKEYKGMGDLLGTGTVAPQNKVFLPLIEAKIEARKIAKKLRIKTQKDWSEAYSAGQIPDNLPSSLWTVYKRDGATEKRLREKRRRK